MSVDCVIHLHFIKSFSFRHLTRLKDNDFSVSRQHCLRLTKRSPSKFQNISEYFTAQKITLNAWHTRHNFPFTYVSIRIHRTPLISQLFTIYLYNISSYDFINLKRTVLFLFRPIRISSYKKCHIIIIQNKIIQKGYYILLIKEISEALKNSMGCKKLPQKQAWLLYLYVWHSLLVS